MLTIQLSRFFLFILALSLIIGFIKLGSWQWMRAEERQAQLLSFHALQAEAPILWHSGDPTPLQYQRIRITGHYLPNVWLLDNQIVHHQIGYDVISPVLLDHNTLLLVNRGWVPMGRSRDDLPTIDWPKGEQAIIGYAYFPSHNRWNRGSIIESRHHDLMVIERLDLAVLARSLHQASYPFMIRLDPKAPHGYVRAWPIVSMSPERHRAYAFQWFLFAFVTGIIVIGLTIKTKYAHHPS